MPEKVIIIMLDLISIRKNFDSLFVLIVAPSATKKWNLKNLFTIFHLSSTIGDGSNELLE